VFIKIHTYTHKERGRAKSLVLFVVLKSLIQERKERREKSEEKRDSEKKEQN
jgi:hypothetical protein